MKKKLFVLLFALAVGGAVWVATGHAQGRRSAPTAAELRPRLQAFLNRTLGWQQLDSIQIESISAPDPSGIRTAKVLLTKGPAHQEGIYYITRDGREIIEGQASPLSGDPWARQRAELQTKGAPAEGAVNAPVTIVEFSDLECPFCKEESASLDHLMQADPGKVRLVFKYYPLTAIHPWSMQAAVAGACVARQSSADFWAFAQTVFQDQDQITLATAPQRLRGIALESGVPAASYDACVASPEARATVEASIANGDKLGVASTPTLFIDGRMIPGAVKEAELQLLVDHEATFREQERAVRAATSGPGRGGLDTGVVTGPQCGHCTPLPPLPPQKQR